jgi:choline transport protein
MSPLLFNSPDTPIGNITVQMYAVKHASFVPKSWHVFLSSIIITWFGALTVCFGNKLMPKLNGIGIVFILGGVFITIVVLAAMPGSGGRPPHAPSSFVWTEWQLSGLGYPSGFVFVAGMLNGAFAVGTPDCVTHLAEEIPRPGINVPKAIAFQMVIGFFSGFFYLIALMYSINDYEALFAAPFPVAEIYYQATGSAAGEIGLLFLLFVTIILTVFGVYITCGRVLWTLARDGATPFPAQIGKIDKRLGMPFVSTILCASLVTVLLCIYVGSTTAFNAFVGSFILLSTSSYTAAILPNLLTKRKNIIYGPFHMKGALGFVMNAIACAYMMVWFVIYCFPYALPTTASSMNYACLIWGGLTVFVVVWWFVGAKNYRGPQTVGGIHSIAEEVKTVEEIRAGGRQAPAV